MNLRSIKNTIAAVFTTLSMVSLSAFSNEATEAVGAKLTSQVKQEVIKELRQSIETHYVDEDKAMQIAAHLNTISKSLPSDTDTAEQFTAYLTKALQDVSDDKHLRVEFSTTPLSIKLAEDVVTTFEDEAEKAMWKSNNLGFDKLERLPFNIGYMKLFAFPPKDEAAPMLASAFTFLNNSQGLIIDLRGNFGGYEYTNLLFASYFLEESTHLLDMHWRKNNKREERWSSAEVAGPKYAQDKKVYILVDNETFSAAEAFSYTMKHLGRAVIVGEQTAGAGNAGEDVQLTSHFKAFIPMRKAISPLTQDSFEGKGVAPDIQTTSEGALAAAQLDYLTSLSIKTQNKRKIERIKQHMARLKTGLAP